MAPNVSAGVLEEKPSPPYDEEDEAEDVGVLGAVIAAAAGAGVVAAAAETLPTSKIW